MVSDLEAFDQVHRETVFQILELYVIPLSIMNAIKALYTGTKSSDLTPDG